jgi:hypothetical protein
MCMGVHIAIAPPLSSSSSPLQSLRIFFSTTLPPPLNLQYQPLSCISPPCSSFSATVASSARSYSSSDLCGGIAAAEGCTPLLSRSAFLGDSGLEILCSLRHSFILLCLLQNPIDLPMSLSRSLHQPAAATFFKLFVFDNAAGFISPGWLHTAELHGLQPGVVYSYTIPDCITTPSNFSFLLPPPAAADARTRFIV